MHYPCAGCLWTSRDGDPAGGGDLFVSFKAGTNGFDSALDSLGGGFVFKRLSPHLVETLGYLRPRHFAGGRIGKSILGRRRFRRPRRAECLGRVREGTHGGSNAGGGHGVWRGWCRTDGGGDGQEQRV